MYPIKMKEFKELLDGRAYISTDNKVYRIEAMTEVENVQADVRKYFARTLKEMDSAFKRSYDELLNKQKTARADGQTIGFKSGLDFANKLPTDWELLAVRDNDYQIINEDRIYAKQIKKGSSVMKIPNSLAHKFYAEKIIVTINYDQHIINGDGYGFNPHFAMNIPTDENGIMVDNYDVGDHKWQLCLGDMNGKEISKETLKIIEKELETINLDSAHSGLATVQAEKLFSKGEADKRTKKVIWDVGMVLTPESNNENNEN